MSSMLGAMEDFGMDTISLAGTLEAKLKAIKDAGFTQVMLSARDVVSHPEGFEAAVNAVKTSGLRVTGFQVLRDFEGLSGHLHHYKIDIAKDLRKLAMLALPLGIKVAFEALSWGRTINEFQQAWEVIQKADAPNLGLGLDSFHLFATKSALDDLELLDPEKIFLVQLADFMWQEVPTFEDRMTTARHFRVFPGEGVHSDALAELVTRLYALGYRGDYSFEVFNDDYQQLPLSLVAKRAWQGAQWLGEDVLHRSVPLPNQIRLKK